MTTITKLFEETKWSVRGIAACKNHFAYLDVAGRNHHGTLEVKRIRNSNLGAWISAISIHCEATGETIDFQGYGDTANYALELVKTHMLKWARSLEMVTA